MNSLAFATIAELQEKLARKELSASELLQFCIARFKEHDEQLGAALEVFDKESLLKEYNLDGILKGIPGIAKDNIAQKGRSLTCASKILKGFRSNYDSTAVSRLKQQGGVVLGRANMDEFAMGSSTETSAYRQTKNPWDLSRVPGGSSGGSIAAVAAGLVPWSLGSETGGSVRQPAAFCGIVGLKPTYGLISRFGLVAYTSSIDQIGIATRTVRDNAIVLSCIAGHDVHDSSSAAVKPHDYTDLLSASLKPGIKIGVVENALGAQGMDDEILAAIEQAIKQLEKLGAKVTRISLPTLDYTAAAYFIISRAEAASNLARFDGIRYGSRNKDASTLAQVYNKSRHDGFGIEVKSRILIGNYVLSVGHADEYYDNARRVQRLIRRDFNDSFEDVDLLVMPTHPVPAFKFGAYSVDKLQMDLQDYFTCGVNLAGVPALSIPCGITKNNLPIGFQLIGPHFSESLIYHVAHAYEQSTPWHTMHPKGY